MLYFKGDEILDGGEGTLGDEGGEVNETGDLRLYEFEGGFGVVEVEDEEVGFKLEGGEDEGDQSFEVDLALGGYLEVEMEDLFAIT